MPSLRSGPAGMCMKGMQIEHDRHLFTLLIAGGLILLISWLPMLPRTRASWATVNKDSGGGKKTRRDPAWTHGSSSKGGHKGGTSQSDAQRSACAKREREHAAITRMPKWMSHITARPRTRGHFASSSARAVSSNASPSAV